jgi:general secretion pathway protein B
MSYILEALKKAERERSIRSVPTLMTEHDPEAKLPRRHWGLLAALLICSGAVVWFVLLLQKTLNAPAPENKNEEYASGARESGTSEPGATASSALIPQKTESPGERSAAPQQPAVREAVTAIPREFPAANTLNSQRLQEMADWMAAANRQADEDAIPNAQLFMTDRPPARTPLPAQASRIEKPAAAEPQAKPASLKDALNEMTLSILVYDENNADRMVFINGRKYVEGDYVEDTYLLESITLDGAYLTYQGERALLRPKAK